MGEKTPGVVAVNTFCRADSKYFAGYIGYMDREEAVRKEHIEDFDLFSEYMGYMGNRMKTKTSGQTEKISGLFTSDADVLTGDEIGKLKDVYKQAQRNGSLMWQTVISFDNSWLEDMGVYDQESHLLDEKRMRTAVRASVNAMMQSENLENAVWSAAFHYNTDNIHVHIAAVEPEPMREKRRYKQYEVIQVKGKWQYKRVKNQKTGRMERVPILDAEGNEVATEEYVGRFRSKSLKTLKRTMVQELTNDKDANIQINSLIRETLVGSLKDYELYQDPEFRERFLALYQKLPEDRRVCHYGNNAMKPLRNEIDELSRMYLERYHGEEYEQLQTLLSKQARRYKIAYGGEENHYYEKKVDDLYSRLGNAILREMKMMDHQEKEKADEIVYSPGKPSAARTSHPKTDYNAARQLRSAFYWLKRSMDTTLEHYRNELDYEKLQEAIHDDLSTNFEIG